MKSGCIMDLLRESLAAWLHLARLCQPRVSCSLTPAFGTGRVWVTKLWQESREVMQVICACPTEQLSYATLLSELPQAALEFYAAEDLVTDEGKSGALLH